MEINEGQTVKRRGRPPKAKSAVESKPEKPKFKGPWVFKAPFLMVELEKPIYTRNPDGSERITAGKWAEFDKNTWKTYDYLEAEKMRRIMNEFPLSGVVETTDYGDASA